MAAENCRLGVTSPASLAYIFLIKKWAFHIEYLKICPQAIIFLREELKKQKQADILTKEAPCYYCQQSDLTQRTSDMASRELSDFRSNSEFSFPHTLFSQNFI